MSHLYTTDGTPFDVDRDVYAWAKHFEWTHLRIGMGYAYLNEHPRHKPNQIQYLHRIIALAPRHAVVHHESGDSTDNRRANMVVMSQAENVRLGIHTKAHTYFRAGIFRRSDGTYRSYLKLGPRRWQYLGDFGSVWEARFCRELAKLATLDR